MKLYNTLTRKLENFRPQDPENVKIYTCGPTVYSMPHIGNYAAYVYWDLLLRTLEGNGWKVNRVLNLTDVGHLSSDADEGEDKLEKGARKSGKTVWEVAEYYSMQFLEGYHALNLLEPAKIARATDYIAADQKVVQTLIDKGYTYETRDGIYYDTTKFPAYADFAHLDLEQLKAGARVALSDEKRHISDFAIWKFIQPGEKHAMRWDFLGRPGYPGWHLECSTIIHEELGEPIDIHTGGIDHIPIHHTNEIAQSAAAFDRQLSRFWLHCNFLTVAGEKISKSLGNTITLQDIQDHGFSPLDFKLWVLQGHYQSERDFTWENLAAAHARRLNWRNRIARARQATEQNGQNSQNSQKAFMDKAAETKLFAAIFAELNQNLNSPAAFALIDGADLTSLAFWQQIDEWFGLGLLDDSPVPSAEVQTLLKQREVARAAKDYAESDRLRDKLAAMGFAILDTPEGQIWQYLK